MTAPERYALAGSPIATSPSPAMHNAAFAAIGRDAEYSLRPAAIADAPAVLDELRSSQWTGLNVTIPLKTVLAHEVHCVGAAARAGAVNTLWQEDGALLGCLTDVEGVTEPLRNLGMSGPFDALVIGAGGAARAAMLALDGLGARVHVAARRPPAATAALERLDLARPGEVLALPPGSAGQQQTAGSGLATRQANTAASTRRERSARRGARVGPRALSESAQPEPTSDRDSFDDTPGPASTVERVFSRLQVVVQATPVGQNGARHRLPWQCIQRDCVAFEMLYLPRHTPFLRDAAAAGCRVVEGWQMLLAQGAASFTRWTGGEAPRDVMQRALLAELAATEAPSDAG